MNEGQGQAQAQLLDPAFQTFQNIKAELANVSISSIVSRFHGNAKNFREWITSIEKYNIANERRLCPPKINSLPDRNLEMPPVMPFQITTSST